MGVLNYLGVARKVLPQVFSASPGLRCQLCIAHDAGSKQDGKGISTNGQNSLVDGHIKKHQRIKTKVIDKLYKHSL
jgi:hypothetical protein